jgi:hypothetical protein
LTLSLAAAAAWIGLSAPAQAIPVFARQTGHNCQACHISYPELTAYGREFKLNGYTFGEAQPLPLAAAIMAEFDHVGTSTDRSTGSPTCSNAGGATSSTCDKTQLVQYSVFFGGRISDNFGMFGQMSGGEFPVGAGGPTSNGGGTFTPTADNTEFRYVHRIASDDSLEPDAVIGFNMNNNPTMQDVWNAVPAWRFPWFPYLGAGFGPSAAPYIDNPSGGHNKIGIGGYAWIHKSWYAELELYRAATGIVSFMNWGSGGTLDNMGTDVLKGYNPYYRLAYSHDWGYHSIEVGIFGMHARTYNCNPNTNVDASGAGCATPGGATNSYSDIAIDGQYQYNRNEPWVFSASGSYIHESANLSALATSIGDTVTDHTLNELQIRGTAYYNRQFGATLGYSMLSGTTDTTLFGASTPGSPGGGSATGNPGSNWWTLELNYLPMQDLRFSLLYQNFTKINGGGSNFDGAGNNASGQNRITGAIWWVF